MKKRWLSLALVLALVLSLCTSAFAAGSDRASGSKLLLNGLENRRPETLASQLSTQYKPGDQVRAIVLMKSNPIADLSSFLQQSASAYEKLLAEHKAFMEKLQQLAIAFTVNFEYTDLLNGLSLTLDFADLDAVASIPGVSDVIVAREYRLPVEQPSSVSASEMINASWLNDTISADGSGKVIAVLDTGITADHEAFGVYDGMLQTPAYTRSDMVKAILRLGHGSYYSQKIPYQYDYADKDLNAADDNSGHGSHVAGIAAGYAVTPEGEVTFRGSAPDAQILAMKIFSSTEETTSSDIYMAALEDAYKLGADVINMSIGATSGFVEDDESVLNDRIYERLENAGIVCCVSAGNEGSMADNAQNFAGPGYLTTGYTDYGTLGSPASYNGNIAVASAENVMYPAYQISVGGEKYSYRDSDGTTFLDAFSGQDLSYVLIPNLGAAEDYEGIDVQGKVAVVSRGEITFEEKAANAANAGASALVVYDNQPGSLISMAIETKTIPAVFVSQEAGAALAAQEELVFHVDSEATIVDNPEAWDVSSFSSWGPTNDLQIKPVITAIGGNVNSVSAGTTNGYEVMSGTSMSSPNAAGGFASLLDAIQASNPALSKKDAADQARNRTASSANTLIAYYDDNGVAVPYSPRQQGAGCLDLEAAYHTTLVVEDPFAELGDDPARDGVYTITADVVNTTYVTRSYAVNVDVLMDAVAGDNFGTDEEPDFHIYNVMAPAALEAGVDYTLSAPESITLAPGEHQTVTVTITLTADMKEFLDAYFENGAFLDGYVYFDSLDEDVSESQHVTFLTYYGDWAAAPIFETHDWREILSLNLSEEEMEEWQYYVDWEIDTVPSEAYLVNEENEPMFYAGDNPFGYPEDGTFSDARIAVSTNADQAYSTDLLAAPVNVRNAQHIIMIARDAETGKIYGVDDEPFCRKIVYDPTYGWSLSAWFLFEGMDASGKKPVAIPDDTKVVLDFYANLPWGEDVLGSMTPEQIVSDGAAYLGYSIPCVVDSAAPVIESCDYNRQTGEVTVTVKDNQYLAAIYAVDEEGNELCEPVTFADTEPGQSHTVTMNVGEQNTFYVAAMDYATNEASTQASQKIFIVQQPQDVYAKRGDYVQFKVEATGNGLKYQWQYRAPSSKIWLSSLNPGAKTDTLNVLASSLREGYQYRCVLTDALGNRITTDAATLYFATSPVITRQPESVKLSSGETAQFTVVATGGALEYQWQYLKPGSSGWKNSTMPGASTDTVTVEATAARNGQQYRCVVSNALGSVTSESATLSVWIIRTQPKDYMGAVNSKATFSISAQGEDLRYQWQYSDDNGETWVNSSVKSDVYNTTLTAARDGRLVRCIVTDQNGTSVASDSAAMRIQKSLSITTQPVDVSAPVGNTVAFRVEAAGDGLKYQWQFSDDGGKTWSDSVVKSAIYTTKLTAERDGRLVRCVVTDQYGGSVISDTAVMTSSGIVITLQPEDVTAKENTIVSFKVAAKGIDLTYQWQISDDGTTWIDSSVKAARYSTKLTAAKDGRMVRCLVTDAHGDSVISDAATMTIG